MTLQPDLPPPEIRTPVPGPGGVLHVPRPRLIDRVVKIEMLLAVTMLSMAVSLSLVPSFFVRIPALKFMIDHYIPPAVLISFLIVVGLGQVVAVLVDRLALRVMMAFLGLFGWAGLGWVFLSLSVNVFSAAFILTNSVFAVLVVIRNHLSDESPPKAGG